MMDRKMVNFIKEQYPPGTRIRLNSMEDPYAPILPGTEGEVDFVDDEGQIFTNWNNGRTLPLIPGEDSFTVLPPKLTTLKLYMPLTADLYERNEYGDFDDSSTLLEGRELRGYQDQITAALVKNRMPEEAERGIMHWYHTRELRSLGIAVIFEEQNINSIYPESEFLIALHAAFAQSESESISANVRWGKRQSIKDGKVTFQYKTLLGYEKGPDGNPVIIPEEAETVRRIFEWYLAGKSVRDIRLSLVAGGFRNAVGTTDWTTSNLRSILTNEKYCGDALLQKTFVKDCISKKSIPNTGQLAKVLIQNNHEAIISHEIFDAVQLELARRRAQDGRSRKSAPTGRGKFSGKYALSGLLFCAECGTAYRRVVWTQHGEKRAVWRCTSRLDYGRKYCLNSPTLDEEPLQQAILNAINSVMSDHSALAEQLRDTMEQELSPIPGESMSLGDIDRAIADLGRQFTALLSEAADADNADGYTARFQSISTAMAEFKRRKAIIQQLRQEQDQTNHRIQRATMALESTSNRLTEWDDGTIYQLLEKVTVLSRERIRVTLRDGLEIEQAVEQPKRRKFA